VKKWVIALVIGLGLIAFSFKGKESTIECGGKTMQPGYVCERNGSTQTYTEMKEAQEDGQRAFEAYGRWVFLGLGALLTVGGTVGILLVRRSRNNAPLPQGMTPLPPQYNHPPQMSYPQQAPYPPQAQYPQAQYPPQNFGPTGPRP
jgi:hypothetical protein